MNAPVCERKTATWLPNPPHAPIARPTNISPAGCLSYQDPAAAPSAASRHLKHQKPERTVDASNEPLAQRGQPPKNDLQSDLTQKPAT